VTPLETKYTVTYDVAVLILCLKSWLCESNVASAKKFDRAMARQRFQMWRRFPILYKAIHRVYI
jgi:hypothetical protein